MVVVIRNRKVVLAHTESCIVLLRGCRDFLVLFLLKDVILGRSTRLLSLMHRHILIHVRHIVIIILIHCLLCGTTCAPVIVHIIDHLVHVRHLASLARVRWPRLKPAILKLDFLYGTRGRLDICNTFLAGHAFRDQELLFLREIIIKLASVAASPPLVKDTR